MKLVFIVLMAILIANTALAQDNIVLKTGEEIKAKVAEVGINEIKYHKTDNPTGPVYTINKADVLLITYQNGSKDVFNNYEKSGTQNTAPNKDNNPYNSKGQATGGDYNKYHKMAIKRIVAGAVMTGIGAPVLLTGVGLTVAGIATLNSTVYYGSSPIDGGGGGQMLATGAILTAAGLALEIVGPITLKKGLKYRRMAQESRATMGFAPIVDSNLDRYRAINQTTLGAITFTF